MEAFISKDFFLWLLGLGTLLTGSYLGWFFSRKTKSEELRALELKNVAAIIEQEQRNAQYWQQQSKQDREEREKVFAELIQERQLRKTYENEVQQLRFEVAELKNEVNVLRTIVKSN